MKENRVTKIFIICILLLFCLFGLLYLSRQILAPFIISGLICYLLSPLINKIMLLGIKRWVAVSFFTMLIVAVFIFVVSLIVPVITSEINSLVNNYPKYETYIKEKSNDIVKKVPLLKKYNIMQTKKDSENGVANLIIEELENLPQHITSLASTITFVILIPIITFFMLLGANKLKDSFIQLVPAKYVEFFISLFYEINFVLGGYIRGQIIEVCFIAISTSLILLIFGVKYAIMIGAISGLFNIIPYLGPAVAMILGVCATAIEYKSFTLVLEVFIALEIIQQLDGHVVQPLVVGKNVNLSPVMMIFALLLGANIGGIIGMLVSVPAFAILKNISVIFINKYRKNLLA